MVTVTAIVFPNCQVDVIPDAHSLACHDNTRAWAKTCNTTIKVDEPDLDLTCDVSLVILIATNE